MKRSLHFQGYTLVELLIVIGIISVITASGIFAAVQYNRNQVITTTANEVASQMLLAKSRAQTQVKPQTCSKLDGYQVIIQNTSGGMCGTATGCYAVTSFCSGAATPVAPEQVKKLPSGVSFSTSRTFTFQTLTNNVTGAATEALGGTSFTLSGFSRTKTFTVFNDGRIRLN